MRWWRQLRDMLEGSMRQQITRMGLVFSCTVGLVGVAAFVSGNNLLFLLLAALLSTILMSGFVSRLGLAGLELSLLVPPHVAARRNIAARLIVRNRKYLTPSFSLHISGSEGSGLRDEIYLPLVPARSTINEPVELHFKHRGIFKDNTFAFASRFPFGFTHRRAHVRLKQEVLVYPSIDPQPGFESILSQVAGEIESNLRGRGSDFYRIRPYEYMESARHVDWRASAHIGELHVREFAREQDQTVTLFLDLHVAPNEFAWFETAVDCCAFLVWRLNERGTRLRFLTQRFDRRVPDEATVYDILRYLALVEPLPGARPAAVPDDDDLPITVSARAAELAEAGWVGVALPPPDSALPTAGAKQP
jgi:uncharacterized protein (DUF58 family)